MNDTQVTSPLPAQRRAAARRSIVVGTDFSEGARDAVARAVEIARDSDARVEVVHAAPRLPRALARAFLGEDPSSEREREELERIVAELRGDGVPARTHLLAARPVGALRSAAREHGALVVVVGARGRTLPDAVVGSTAERISALSRIPVLLVRNRAAGSYGSAVVAADAHSDVQKSLAAAELVAPGAPIMILHAYEPVYETTLILHGASKGSLRDYRNHARREARQAMSRRLVDAGVDPSALVLRRGDPRRVLEHVDENAPDTLLVLDRRRSIIRHVLLGSVCRWVIAHGRSDVLLA
jgi:nucleotide-binding universal stress UspA family protein